MTNELFDEQKDIGRENGIFTLARGWTTRDKQAGIASDESFEAFLETVDARKLAEAETAVGSSKVRQGRWLAENLDLPDRRVSPIYKLGRHAWKPS